MKTLRLIILAFVLAIPARAQVHLLVTTNGVLMAPVDFFTLNSNLIVAAVGGAFGGGGTGNASTNVTQAWAAANTQTFLGPVYFGTTNIATALAGKQNSDAQLDVVANLTSGTATNFLAGDGTFKQVTTNMVPGLVADILAAAAAGGAGDVTLAGTNDFTGPNSFAADTTASNLTVTGTLDVGDLTADSLTLLTPIGLSNGGTGGTNAASARSAIGAQEESVRLQELAAISYVSGDLVYYDGANIVRIPSTAAGRSLLAAVNAADARNQLVVGELSQTTYGAGWDGETGKTATLDAIYDWGQALPGGSNSITTWNTNYFSVSGGYLDWVGGSTGGGSAGYTYLVTNVGGAFQSRTAGTNWVVLSTTVSSNYAPVGTGRFLEGGYGVVMSNYSGTSANTVMRIKANGTLVFQDAAGGLGSGSVRTITENFRIVRASDTLASIISVGSWVSGSAGIGRGDFGGSSPLGNSKTITNVAWNWSTNNSLEISIDCDTSTSTNDALGISVSQAFLRAEGASSGGGGTGDVVGPASATDDNIATFDGTTGKLIQDGGTSIASLATEAEVAAGYQPLDSDLTDLADGTLTGSKVGSGIDDDNVSFDDEDSLWTATTIGAALEELHDSINAGVPNGTGAKLHWSQLLGVPAGFADGTDDGGGGSVATNSLSRYEYVDELLSNTWFVNNNGGGNTAISTIAVSTLGYPFQVYTSSNSQGDFNNVATPGSVTLPASGLYAYEFEVQLKQELQPAADTNRVDAGFRNTYGSTNAAVSAAMFSYQTNAFGPNWQLVTVAASTATITDTGIAVANSWTNLSLRLTPTNCIGFVAGIPVATNSSNIPTGVLLVAGTGHQRHAGSTTQYTYLDRFRILWEGPAR